MCSSVGGQLMVPHVIIVGGGFGGLSAARALRGAGVRVTLIDKRNYHLFRPMLYQVATGLLSADEISGPLRSILSHQENIDVLLDEVTGISPKQRIAAREARRDVLVAVLGEVGRTYAELRGFQFRLDIAQKNIAT